MTERKYSIDLTTRLLSYLEDGLIQRGNFTVSPRTLKNYMFEIRPFFQQLVNENIAQPVLRGGFHLTDLSRAHQLANEFMRQLKSKDRSNKYIQYIKTILNVYVFRSREDDDNILRVTVPRGRTGRLTNRYSQIIITNDQMLAILQYVAQLYESSTTNEIVRRRALRCEFLMYYFMLGTLRRKADIHILNWKELQQLLRGESLVTLCVKSNSIQTYRLQQRYRSESVDESRFVLMLEQATITQPVPIYVFAKNLFESIEPQPDDKPLFKQTHSWYSRRAKQRITNLIGTTNVQILRHGHEQNRINRLYGSGVHEFRRFAITDTYESLMLKYNENINLVNEIVRKFAGHVSFKTTSTYLRNQSILQGFEDI